MNLNVIGLFEFFARQMSILNFSTRKLCSKLLQVQELNLILNIYWVEKILHAKFIYDINMHACDGIFIVLHLSMMCNGCKKWNNLCITGINFIALYVCPFCIKYNINVSLYHLQIKTIQLKYKILSKQNII